MLACALLAGCGAQSVRDDATGLMAAGDYEKALKTLDKGLLRYPGNVTLRAGQVTARAEVLSRLVIAANNARNNGNTKEAAALVQRALEIDPTDARVRALRLDVERDMRGAADVSAARELLGKGLRERAMLVIEAGLKDDPRNDALRALQRKVELESRRAELVKPRLAETRPVSLDFRDANVRMVLDVLTRNSGINFVLDKDVRPDTRASVYMQQVRVEDAIELITSTNQLAYKVIDASTVLVYPRTPEKLKEYQDLLIRAFYLSSAEAKQTAIMLKSMLKIREPFVDEKLNLITIRETPEIVRLAERLIALHDQSEPEVMMEVEVLEVQRSGLTELGIKFPDSLTLTPIAPATGFTLGNVRDINRDTIGVNVPSLTLNLHRDVGDVHILANPKIRARNHEKAKVLIGDKLPVVTTTGSAANNGFFSESVQYVDVGLKLDVEPTVYLDDEVAIKIGLEVSSLAREIKTSGGSLVYQIGTRTANTVLRLRDGETQLLAGLISNEERMSANRIPGLGDMPVVGRLFASQRDSGQRTEIVLAVTPHIIRNVRRPDLNETEFWSGTENDIRSKPLAPMPADPANPAPAGAAAGATAPAAPTGSPGPAPMPPAAGAPGAPGAAPAPAPLARPVLRIVAPAEVKAGDTFSVDVALKSEQALRGLPLQLLFDKKLLTALEPVEGIYFKADGAAVSKSKSVEQAEGRVAMAVMRNGVEGLAGDGAVVSFRFKALAAGNAELTLAPTSAIANGVPLPLAAPAPVRVSIK